MIKVTLHKQGNYPVSATKIKKAVSDTLRDEGLVSDFKVDVALVGTEKMKELVETYYEKGSKEEHPILTFPTSEITENFVYPPNETTDLGGMVISYPWIINEAKSRGKLINDVACEIAIHGALHLAGIHH